MKFKVVKEHDDYASKARIGQIIEVLGEEEDLVNEGIVNICGAHYETGELLEYFEPVDFVPKFLGKKNQ